MMIPVSNPNRNNPISNNNNNNDNNDNRMMSKYVWWNAG